MCTSSRRQTSISLAASFSRVSQSAASRIAKRSVDADHGLAGAGGDVVAAEPALSARVEPSSHVERQRMGRDQGAAPAPASPPRELDRAEEASLLHLQGLKGRRPLALRRLLAEDNPLVPPATRPRGYRLANPPADLDSSTTVRWIHPRVGSSYDRSKAQGNPDGPPIDQPLAACKFRACGP
jgi:hypothetical protein